MNKENSGLQALQDFIFYSKYARKIPGTSRKETWAEAVDRVINMHEQFLSSKGVDSTKIQPYLDKAKKGYLSKKAIGAQRSLQWGGDQLLKHHFRSYNCSASYLNRVDFFREIFYILLCGAGK